MLGLGIITGAMWANVYWGRFCLCHKVKNVGYAD